MALECGWDGVGQSSDRLNTRAGVREGGEVGGKEGVGLADVEVDLEPSAGGGEGFGGQVVLFEPCLNSRDRVGTRSGELLGLIDGLSKREHIATLHRRDGHTSALDKYWRKLLLEGSLTD